MHHMRPLKFTTADADADLFSHVSRGGSRIPRRSHSRLGKRHHGVLPNFPKIYMNLREVGS